MKCIKKQQPCWIFGCKSAFSRYAEKKLSQLGVEMSEEESGCIQLAPTMVFTYLGMGQQGINVTPQGKKTQHSSFVSTSQGHSFYEFNTTRSKNKLS